MDGMTVKVMHGHECPDCKCNLYHYDSFEDMYCCVLCQVFWYPQEIGAKENFEPFTESKT